MSRAPASAAHASGTAEPARTEPGGSTEPDRSTEPKGAEPKGAEPKRAEPDARFTFANERTFLAWSRTALALVVAGLAIAQLLPPFPGIPLGRHLLAVPLIVLGAAVSVIAYAEWGRNQRALRRGQPLPRSPLPRILAATIAAMAIAAAIIVLLSAALK